MNCCAPGCPFEGVAWPIVLVGRLDGGAPYRLEVPRATCAAHSGAFQPLGFLAPAARDQMKAMAAQWCTGELDFDNVSVEWHPLTHPAFLELDGSEARFCAPVAA